MNIYVSKNLKIKINKDLLNLDAMRKNNYAIIIHALNIARRSNRIIQVATQEAENSEDNIYVNNIYVDNIYVDNIYVGNIYVNNIFRPPL